MYVYLGENSCEIKKKKNDLKYLKKYCFTNLYNKIKAGVYQKISVQKT